MNFIKLFHLLDLIFKLKYQLFHFLIINYAIIIAAFDHYPSKKNGFL